MNDLNYHDFPADAETLNSLDTTDDVQIEKIPRDTARVALKPQPSQKPGPSMMEAAAQGNAEASAIRDAWKFSIPVRKVSRAEYATMIKRNDVIFHGK